MGLIILAQVLFLFFVTVGGRAMPVEEDCDLRIILTTVKDVLKEEVQEKCSTAYRIPDKEECVPYAIDALQPCLADLSNREIQAHCSSDVFMEAQNNGTEGCFCKGVTSLVESLHRLAPLVCSSSDSRGSRMYNSWAAATGVTAKPMIIDTDMANDVNDPLALCAAHAIEKEGYAEIKAVVSNVGYPKIIGAVSVINHFFGRDHIKLGAYKGKFGDDFAGGMGGNFVDDLLDNFPSPVRDYNSVDDAVETIKQTLTEAEDNTIVYVAIGFMINLRDFLKTDENKALFAKKVKEVFIMGGQYDPETKTPEFNFGCGIWDGQENYSNTDACKGSAKEAVDNIPDTVPVRFLGYEVGDDLWTGSSLWSWCKAYSTKNPCFRALDDWAVATGNKTTQTWDPLTVTAAAGSAMTIGSVLEGQNGKIKIAEDGANTWEYGFPDSKQLYYSKRNKYIPLVQMEKLYCMSNLYTIY